MSDRVFETAVVGLLLPSILDRCGSATVLAAFERSFYLQTERDLFAIATASLHDGPLTIRLRGEGHPPGIVPGQHWTIGPERLQREDGAVIDLEHASIWQPAAPSMPIERQRLRSGLDHLHDLLAQNTLPEDGLIRLVIDRSIPANPIERAAAKSLSTLSRSLARALAGKADLDARPAIDLLGLGPGLTPSGDDLLAGLLLACRLLGAHDVADHLGKALVEAAPERTNRISLAHLEAAASGYAAAPLHDLLGVLVQGERQEIAEALDATAKIGHSSGFDALFGIVLALRAWLETPA